MSRPSSAGSTAVTQLDILHCCVSRGLGRPRRKVRCVLGYKLREPFTRFYCQGNGRHRISPQPELDFTTRCGCTRTSSYWHGLWVTEGGFVFGRANGRKTVQRAAESNDGGLLVATLLLSIHSDRPRASSQDTGLVGGTAAPPGELRRSCIVRPQLTDSCCQK